MDFHQLCANTGLPLPRLRRTGIDDANMRAAPVTLHLIETDAASAASLLERLTAHGFRIQGLSASVAEARAQCSPRGPELILVGPVLAARTDNLELERQLRPDFTGPILFLSPEPARPEEREPSHAIHHLAPPFSDRELAATVQVAVFAHRLHQPEEPAASLLTLADQSESHRLARLGHWALDVVHDRVEWSDTLFALFGLSRTTFHPSHAGYLHHVVWPEDRPLAEAAEKNVFATKQPQEVVHRIRHADGSSRWVRICLIPQCDHNGHVTLLRGIAQEVTEAKRTEDALLALNLRLEHLVSATPVTIYTRDTTPEHACTFVSSNVTRLLGYPSAEFTTAPEFWLAHVHPEDRPLVQATLPRLQPGEQHALEYRFQRRDGTWLWLYDEFRLLRAEGSRPVEFIGYLLDITARKQAEARLSDLNASLEMLVLQRTRDLRESEARYRSLFDESPVPILLSALPDGRIVHTNAAALAHFKYRPEEVVGRNGLDLALWANPADREHFLAELRDKGRIENFEAPMRLKDGRVVIVLHNSRVVQFDGQPHAVSTVLDVTAHKAAEAALRASEESLRQLTNASPAGIFATDAQGRCHYVSQRWCQLTGLSPEEASRDRWPSVLHPDDRQRVLAEWQAALHAQRAFSAEYRFIHPVSRNTVWVLGQAQPLRDEGDRVTGYIGTITAVTEERVVELALRTVSTELVHLSGPEFHRAVVASLTTMLECEGAFIGRCVSTDPDTIQLLALRLDGVTREGVPMPLAGSPCGCALQEGGMQTFTDVAARFPDSVFLRDHGIVGYTALPFKDASGKVRGLLGVLSRRAEPNLRRIESVLNVFASPVAAEFERDRSSRRFRDLFEFSTDAILLANSDGAITHLNQRAVDLFGWSREEMLGMSIEQLVPEDVRATHTEQRRRYASASVPRRVSGRSELYALRKDGTRFPVDISLSPLDLDDGMVIAASIRDMTKLHEAEELRRRAEAEIQQAQKMESIGTLAGGIAHDFNNILTGMMGFVELARQDLPANSPARQWIESIGTSGQRAKALVRQILTFSRKDARKELAPTRLQVVVHEALDLLRSTLPAMVRLERRIVRDCPPVMADATQIHQVVLNLCTNAWHALPEQGGVITVELEPCEITARTHPKLKPGQGVRLVVSDNGCGMTPEVQARIFEPFFTTRKAGQGTGLGLSAVHGIVNGHDGTIAVTSAPERGSRFEITLPSLVTELPAPAIARPYPNGNSERVLFVEDDPLGNLAISTMLQRLTYRVTIFQSPTAALAHFRAHSDEFDLVVTDFAMPVMSGVALIRALRELKPQLPALVLSGNLHKEQQRQLAAEPRTLALLKPVEMADLAESAARLLANAKSAPATP